MTANRKPVLLIVDDAPANIDALRGILMADYALKVATNGALAVKIATASPPDLILLDVMMPGMDGYEVCNLLKADERSRHVPVIFVTARGDIDAETRGFAMGAADYISKPISPPIVLARVRTHVALYNQRRHLEDLVSDSTRQLRESRDLLRTLSMRRENAREDERRYVAREIHDDLGQMLGGLRMRLSTLMLQTPTDNLQLNAQLRSLMDLTDQTIRVVRDVVSKLRTPVLDAGIVPGLEWLINEFQRNTGLIARLALSSDNITLSDDIATVLFRAAQESLTNVARHAQARRVDITLNLLTSECQMEVRDDGKGFDPAVVQEKSFGLEGMRERCDMMGGRLYIASGPGQGTSIRFHIPLDATHAPDLGLQG